MIVQNHKITEYPELKEIHKDHQAQLLALHPQKSHHVPKNIVQMLLEFITLNASLSGEFDIFFLKSNICISAKILKKTVKGFLKSSKKWPLVYNFYKDI